MKAKFVKESLLEFERGKTYDDVKDILEIGDQRVRDKIRLKRFAEENGYEKIIGFENIRDYIQSGELDEFFFYEG